MPLQIPTITATTELEAVNSMLAAIGEAPITDLDVGQASLDVQMATERLRAATREVQTAPWQFNTRFNFPIGVAGQIVVTEDGVTKTLNVFKPLANLAGFEPSLSDKQRVRPDVVIAPSIIYAPAGTLIFYDRVNNREGLIATDYPQLYIDGWFFFGFEQLPETARRYVTVLAARRFIASVLGSQELEGFTLKDEAQALRLLKRDQGDDSRPNMLANPDVYRVLGGSPFLWGR